MKARDLMTSDPTTCRPSDNLKAVISVMRKEDCGMVPITEGNGEQRVTGVATDRDIALALGDRDEKPSAVRVSEVMTTKIVSCEPDSTPTTFAPGAATSSSTSRSRSTCRSRRRADSSRSNARRRNCRPT